MASEIPTERNLIARLGAEVSWARTVDRTARTAPARASAARRWERQVDPDGTMDPALRERMAEHARRAEMIRLAIKSGQARRARSRAAQLEAEVAEVLADIGGDAA